MKKLLCTTFTIIMFISALPSWALSHAHPHKAQAVAPVVVTESEIEHRVIEPRRSKPRASRHRQLPAKRHKLVTESNRALTSGGIWGRLRMCEAGGLYSANTGNGFYGAYQFTLSSWRAVGGNGYPHNATPTEQDRRARALKELQGWGAWPACARKLGLL